MNVSNPVYHLGALCRLAMILVGTGGLLGCATDMDYPSLAPRAIEGTTQTPSLTPADAALPVDAALDAKVASLSMQATSGHTAFERIAGQTCTTIVRGSKGAEGTEPWIAAQQAISSLDAARAPVQAAVAELDRLVIERGVGGGQAVDLARLAAAEALVSRLDLAEQTRMAAILSGNCTADAQ